MDELIARLEAAEEGSRELDCWVAAYVNCEDWKVSEVDGLPIRCGPRFDDPPHYTTSLDAKLPGERIIQVHGIQRGKVTAFALLPGDDFCTMDAEAKTEPIARRLAALKAKAIAAQKEGGSDVG